MSRYSILIALVIFFMAMHIGYSQYWFQSGVTAQQNTSYNQGTSAEIQVNYNQNVSVGSFGFWAGETLSNNAFVQVGYIIENASGNYSYREGCSSCVIYLEKDQPAWFWEYFRQESNPNSTFYGGIGTSGLGENGSFDNFSLEYMNNEWGFFLNGNQIGNVSLGTNNSGDNVPFIAAEDAGTDTNTTYMIPVRFRDVRVFKNGSWTLLQNGYSYVGYGSGSLTYLKNDYGISEINNIANYFEVGSGLPDVQNGTGLWSGSYNLDINSSYGINSDQQYSLYSSVNISEPYAVNISPSSRAVFEGWIGRGYGSYTGSSNSSSVIVYGNITETAVWKVEYRINVTSEFGISYGSGWYSKGEVAKISLNKSIEYESSTHRFVFDGWSNNNTNLTENLVVNSPMNISALWSNEYLVNGSSEYGRISGLGWYINGSDANISLNFSPKYIDNDERIQFYSWSNGDNSTSIKFLVNRSSYFSADFNTAFLENVSFKNINGSYITPTSFSVNGRNYYSNDVFLPEGRDSFGQVMVLGYVIEENRTYNISSPGNIVLGIPMYNVFVHTKSLFDLPVNASVKIRFSNGSVENRYSGNNGTLRLDNVLYGNVTGSAVFGIQVRYFSSSGKSMIYVYFAPKNYLIYLFMIILGVIIASYIFAREYHSRR